MVMSYRYLTDITAIKDIGNIVVGYDLWSAILRNYCRFSNIFINTEIVILRNKNIFSVLNYNQKNKIDINTNYYKILFVCFLLL